MSIVMVMASGKGRAGHRAAWWAEDTELIAFARALVEADELGDPHRVIDYFREPQRWSPAYEIWREAGFDQNTREIFTFTK